MTREYEMLRDLLVRRRSIRRFKPDPLPEGVIEEILEVGRWAMSGANGQPWEYIVVTDPQIKQALFKVYREQNDDFIFWMEQMRAPDLRHPALLLEGELDEQSKKFQARPGWSDAPALIVVVGDGRRQWTTVMGGHTFGRHQSHFTDGLANTCMLIHLAAAALGLGTQWVTIHIEDGFKRILGVPDVMMVYTIIPVGYPDGAPGKSGRRALNDMLHCDQYDLKKHLSNRQIVDFIRTMRARTQSKYIKADKGEGKRKK